jgi:ATP-dependent Clp protease adaptor protein ClpS|tara:strand:+ start:275 stop:577 length:303 start_codon:yes stop_codon:yes gene_type:complete
MTETDIVIDEKIDEIVLEPPRYKVVLLNDDTTPMEWVIEVLVSIFKHSETTAKEITLAIHSEGSGLAGIYSYEIAEQRSLEAVSASRERGFPLQIKLEEE